MGNMHKSSTILHRKQIKVLMCLKIRPRFRSIASGDYKPSKYSELSDGNTQTESSESKQETWIKSCKQRGLLGRAGASRLVQTCQKLCSFLVQTCPLRLKLSDPLARFCSDIAQLTIRLLHLQIRRSPSSRLQQVSACSWSWNCTSKIFRDAD